MGLPAANRTKSLAYWLLLAAGGVGAIALTTTTATSKNLAAASISGNKPFFARPHVAAIDVPDPSAPLIGDSSLRGEIDLSTKKAMGGELVVELNDARKAVLTLDPSIQRRAEKVLASSGANEGAVVVMGLDGRVLAVAGHGGKAADPTLAVEVWAPAASIFKLVTSAALLEEGVKSDTRVCYHGGRRGVDASHLVDNARLDRNCADFTAGLARSQNAIIAKLAAKHLDRDTLHDVAERLGFASAADFALDVEANRFQLPTDELELARVAAGFWSTELSPVGGAILAASIANGGIRINPRIVSEVRGPGGVQRVLPKQGERVLEPEIAASLGDMMQAACETGTARNGFRDPKGKPFLGGKPVAGKTGSLSVSSPKYRGFSWFVGYAPADEPVAVIAVLLANPAKWRLKAHTAARMVLESVL